jgi:hypothetical protein
LDAAAAFSDLRKPRQFSRSRLASRSALHFQVGLTGRLYRRGRFASLSGALSPNVMSQTCGRNQQRHERDEKGN